MRKLTMALAFAFGLVMSFAGLAKADIVQTIGTPLDQTNQSVALNTLKLNGSGKGTATYNFTLGGNGVSELVASFTSSSTGGIKAVTNFTLSLFSGSTALTTLTQSDAIYDPVSGTTTFTLDFANFLAAGNYYLKLVVDGGKRFANISGNLTVSPVPVPAALPMFGAVLVGLVAFQSRRRKSFNV